MTIRPQVVVGEHYVQLRRLLSPIIAVLLLAAVALAYVAPTFLDASKDV